MAKKINMMMITDDEGDGHDDEEGDGDDDVSGDDDCGNVLP